MNAPLKPSTAQDFFDKYGLTAPSDHIDQEINTPGIQGFDGSLEEITQDFDTLSSEHQYAVFVRLENGSEKEILRRLTHYQPDSAGWQSKNSFDIKGHLTSLKKVLKQKEKTNPDIVWTKRLEIEKETFLFSEYLHDIHALFVQSNNDFNYEDVIGAHKAIHEGLKELYQDFGQTYEGNYLWDSDKDFNPYNPSEDAFDHKDVLPLDPVGYQDVDQDGMVDSLDIDVDIDPQDSKTWTKLSVGDTVQVNRVYSITRTGENSFEINVHFRIDADPATGVDEVEAIRSEYLNPTDLSELATAIEDEFAKTTRGGKFDFALNVEFELVEYNKYRRNADILATPQVLRDDAFHWSLDVLSDRDFISTGLHETMHHLGFPDLYHEFIVHGGVRDQTLKPGFASLSKANPMADHTEPGIHLPEEDLQALVEKRDKALFEPDWQPDISGDLYERSKVLVEQYRSGDKEAVLSELDQMEPEKAEGLARYIFGQLGGPYESEADLRREFFFSRHDESKLEDRIKYFEFLASRRSGGKQWFEKRVYPYLNNENPEHLKLIEKYAHSLKETGRHKEALPYYEELLANDTADHLLWVGYAVCLKAEGRDAEFKGALRKVRVISENQNITEFTYRAFDRELQDQLRRYIF